MSAWEMAKVALKYTNPVGWLVAEGAEKAALLVANASDKGIDQLKEEVAKQNLKMQFSQQQARIAQELAIARRIDNADEVEIEEFYDNFSKGNAGATIDLTNRSGSLEFGGEGRRVSKRVYHFKGWRPQDNEVIAQLLEEEKN